MIIIIRSIILLLLLLLLSLLLRPPANKYLLGSITQIPIGILHTLECLGFWRNNHTKLGLSVIRTASLRSWRTVRDFARVKISATKLQEILKRLFPILRPAQQLLCQNFVHETGIYKQLCNLAHHEPGVLRDTPGLQTQPIFDLRSLTLETTVLVTLFCYFSYSF